MEIQAPLPMRVSNSYCPARPTCLGSPQAVFRCVCMCVIMVTMGGGADVALSVAVCFLAKISLHRPTCKTTFACLTQSQAIPQSFREFITLTSMRKTNKFLFFHFRNSSLYIDEKVNAHLPYYSTLRKFCNGFFQTFQAGLLFFSDGNTKTNFEARFILGGLAEVSH